MDKLTKKGLDSTQLKTIALVLMVLDHIHYFFEFTGCIPTVFSMLGRLSAPLFLFCTVEGFAHTHDRKRYFIRIWAIGTAMAALEFFMIYAKAFRRGDGFYPQNAIFQDLMLLCIVWQGIDWLREKKLAKGIAAIAAVLCWPYVVVVFLLLFPGVQEMPIASTVVAFVITSPLPMWSSITDGGWSFLLGGVLLQYLVRTALACLLVAVGWLLVLMLWIQNGGLFLPANQAAQACQKAAQDVLPGMTAATFDETQLDSLCRYALFAAPDSSEVLATNMDAGHLQRAMENRQGKTRWHFGYTQYYMTSKLQDGTVCLLQFDYAVPYSDPALRGVLPDMQTVHCILGILLLVGAVVWSTHRTGRFLTRETEKLTAAAQAVARKDLDSAVFSGAKVREYESALQALQTMGDELTGSLQKQWDMEQRQREQIIRLSHKLKTPLTIIKGNAELLAEDDLTEEQRAQVEAILQGAEQTRAYLGKIRAEVQTPLKYRQRK